MSLVKQGGLIIYVHNNETELSQYWVTGTIIVMKMNENITLNFLVAGSQFPASRWVKRRLKTAS